MSFTTFKSGPNLTGFVAFKKPYKCLSEFTAQCMFYSYCSQWCTLYPYALMAKLVPILWVVSNASAKELKIINIAEIQCVCTHSVEEIWSKT